MPTWDVATRGVLTLPDGRRVRAAPLRSPRDGVPGPDLHLLLLGRAPRDPPPWPVRWVRWRDFGVPASTRDTVAALLEAHDRAAHERVELSCRGGVGRTGTALAALAVRGGLSPDDAVTWVRRHHHRRAIETRGQRRWLHATAPLLDA